MWKELAEVITALVPFGIAGLAIAAIVVLVVRGRWIISSAMALIALIFFVDRYFGISPELAWFDTSGSADWGGQDLAYTTGEWPLYKSSKGEVLCDTGLEGKIAVCWDNRLAKDQRDPTVKDSNVSDDDKRWCAYKDRSIKVTDQQTGRAPKGQVFVCGRYVRRS